MSKLHAGKDSGRKLRSNDGLSWQEKNQKKVSKLTAHFCNQCSTVYTTQLGLTDHQREEHGDRKTETPNPPVRKSKRQRNQKTAKRLDHVSDDKRVNMGRSKDVLCVMEIEMKALIEKYEAKGIEVLVLVADQDHGRSFGTQTARQFVTEMFQPIIDFLAYCTDSQPGNKKKVKAKEKTTENCDISSSADGTDQIHERSGDEKLLEKARTKDIKLDSFPTEDVDLLDKIGDVTDNVDDITDISEVKDTLIVCNSDAANTEGPEASSGVTDSTLIENTAELVNSASASIPEENFDENDDDENQTNDKEDGNDTLDEKVLKDYLAGKGETSHRCDRCDTGFIHAWHLRTHTKKVPYCETTGQEFKHSDKAFLSEEATYTHPDTGETITTTFKDILDQQKSSSDCLICGKSFLKKGYAQKHVLHHSKARMYWCSICGDRVSRHSAYLWHTRQHFNKPYECDHCLKRFVDETGWQEHRGCQNMKLAEEGSDTSLQCDLCNFKCTNEISMTAHLTTHSGPMLCVCTLCGKQVNTMTSLNRHITTVHSDSRPFKCPLCPDKCFKLKEGLNRHLKSHGKKENICKVCGKGFSDKGNLTAHMKIHSDVRPFVCDFCGKGFKRKIFLDTHRRTHTGEAPFKCDIQGCTKEFRSKANLVQHERTHSGETFVCDICGKTFKQPGALGHHRKSHTIEWRWPCPYCPDKYKSIWKFKQHLAQCHADLKEEIEKNLSIRLHHCKICGKVYHDTEDLRRHVNNHNGIRPFQCSECGKSYSDRSNLRTHMLIHTGGRKYRCQVCHKKFMHEKNLHAHVQNKHSKAMPDHMAQFVDHQIIVETLPQAGFEPEMGPLQIQIH